MHTSKDSMWRGIWKILQNFLGTKQGPGAFRIGGHEQRTSACCLYDVKIAENTLVYTALIKWRKRLKPSLHERTARARAPRCCGQRTDQLCTRARNKPSRAGSAWPPAASAAKPGHSSRAATAGLPCNFWFGPATAPWLRSYDSTSIVLPHCHG